MFTLPGMVAYAFNPSTQERFGIFTSLLPKELIKEQLLNQDSTKNQDLKYFHHNITHNKLKYSYPITRKSVVSYIYVLIH